MLGSREPRPRALPDPDRFDIARADARDHLAFGGGAHFCLGAHLARMEAQEAIGALVAALRDARARGRRSIEWGASLFRVPGKLPMRIR